MPYQPLSRFPATSQDLTFRVQTGTPYADVAAAVQQATAQAGNREVALTADAVSIYQSELGAAQTSITFRIVIQPRHATLTTQQASQIMAQVSVAVCQATGAVVV